MALSHENHRRKSRTAHQSCFNFAFESEVCDYSGRLPRFHQTSDRFEYEESKMDREWQHSQFDSDSGSVEQAEAVEALAHEVYSCHQH